MVIHKGDRASVWYNRSMVVTIKLLIWLLRNLTPFSGTALPGLLLEKYFPGTLKSLFGQLDEVVIITGTNGKTTTARFLAHLLRQNQMSFLTNPSGSNMLRGLAAALIDQADWKGKLPTTRALLEVEEATLPRLVKLVKPKLTIVTNIFRDQLDAYGEIDTTRRYLAEAIKAVPRARLILNANDVRVAKLAQFSTAPAVFVGFADKYLSLIKLENRSRTVRDKADYVIDKIHTDEDLKNSFEIRSGKKSLTISQPIPGIQNCFNATLALVGFSHIVNADLYGAYPKNRLDLSTMKAAFGRGEIVRVKNTDFQILLAKNPAGMNLNLHLLSRVKKPEAVLFILNDKIADGRDVSWIWDAQLELLLQLQFQKVFVAGTRRWDMALRLKYAGIEVTRVYDSIAEAVSGISGRNCSKVLVLPTYTAMLELRRKLGKHKIY